MGRFLFVAQRYGHEVAGGAERACRDFATRLAGRGHRVEALTTCAVDYSSWANRYPAGTTDVDGVAVHRLPVAEERRSDVFSDLNMRVAWLPNRVPLHLQHAWMRAQGPYVPAIVPWLLERAPGYDVVVFFTYLYYTTWAGLAATSGRVPTVLHPTAHDEPAFHIDLFDTTLRHPDAFAFFTEEEAALVSPRAPGRPSAVLGIGSSLDVTGDEAEFRRAWGLGDRPYLLYLGRVEIGKGSGELVRFFTAYKERHPGPLALVVMGSASAGDPLPEHPDVVVTGFVSEADKQAALAGAFALAQPSYFESFSLVLVEAWLHRRPALVQGRCAVLDGQARRSGGALPYRGFAEFEAALDWLLEDPDRGRRLGEAGRRYTEQHYAWPVVLDRYETFLDRVARGGPW